MIGAVLRSLRRRPRASGPLRKRLPKKVIAKKGKWPIPEDFAVQAATMTTKALAVRYGCSVTLICKWRKRVGVPTKRSNRWGVTASSEVRGQELAMLYSSGATLEEIGQAVGLTRERVRQLIHPFGVKRMKGRSIDLNAVRQLADKGLTREEAAKAVGMPLSAFYDTTRDLGFTFVNPIKISRDSLITSLQALAIKLGRTPTQPDLNADPDTPSHTTYVHAFGSVCAAQEAAGLIPNKRGGSKRKAVA